MTDRRAGATVVPEANTPPIAKDKDGKPITINANHLLLRAAMLGDVEKVRQAQRLGCDINIVSGPSNDAAKADATEELAKSKDEKPSDKKDDDDSDDGDDGDQLIVPLNTGDTALHLTAENGHVDCAKLLLDLMADIDKPNRIGCTALHRAASHAQVPMVKFLLERKANIHALNKIGNTPLHIACYMAHVDVIHELLHYGAQADFCIRNRVGMTPYDYAPVKLRASLIPYLPKNMLATK